MFRAANRNCKVEMCSAGIMQMQQENVAVQSQKCSKTSLCMCSYACSKQGADAMQEQCAEIQCANMESAL